MFRRAWSHHHHRAAVATTGGGGGGAGGGCWFRRRGWGSASTTPSATTAPSTTTNSFVVRKIHMGRTKQNAGVKGSSNTLIAVTADVEMIAANHRKNSRSFASNSMAAKSPSSTSTAANSTDTTTTTTTTTTITSTSSDADSDSSMKDEYGRMDAAGDSFVVSDFVLENGQVLPRAELRYRTYGTLNETTRDNVLVVCHALTGNASLDGWWGGLLGEGRAFDTSKYLVVCCNILGSCYGSTSPVTICPETQQPYGIDFPDVSVQDTVRLQLRLLREALNLRHVRSVIGGSFGGMQAVEFAVQAGSTSSDNDFTSTIPPFVQSVIPIACNAQHGAWQIAIAEVQRQAIYRDPAWQAGHYSQATQGLQVARQLGMISYRTCAGYAHKFHRRLMSDKQNNNDNDNDKSRPAYGKDADWQVASYLVYQGEKFISRFDPVTYVKLTQQMDSHHVARNRGNDVAAILGRVHIPALVLGIDSDLLYPIQQQQELARLLPQATFQTIHSDEGHNGFLLEQEQVGRYITDFCIKWMRKQPSRHNSNSSSNSRRTSSRNSSKEKSDGLFLVSGV